MDLLDLTQRTRESKLDYDETWALLRFSKFQNDEDSESQMPDYYDKAQVCKMLNAFYPNMLFKVVADRVFAQVRTGVSGTLVEQFGLVSSNIPYLATTRAYNSHNVSIVFRADGIGITKEDSWYEFFRHEFDLEQIKQECQNGEDQISERLGDLFHDQINDGMDDPFFDPEGESCEVYFERGSKDELDRLMKLFILTEPGIEAHEDDNVCLYAASEDDAPYLDKGEYEGYFSERLSQLTDIALEENYPIGWEWEYNDGASDRRSGYDQRPAALYYNIGEIFEQASAREKMAARRDLRQYLEKRGRDLAYFDALQNS